MCPWRRPSTSGSLFNRRTDEWTTHSLVSLPVAVKKLAFTVLRFLADKVHRSVADPGCPPQGGLINRDLEQMSKINDEITSGGANQ